MDEKKYIVKRKYVGIGFGKVLLAVLTAGILLLMIFVGIVSIIVSSGSSSYEIQSNTVLKLTFDKEIKERSQTAIFPSSDTKNVTNDLGLTDIITEIIRAKDNDKIKGIYLNTKTVNAGIAGLQEIRNALIDFKESGKFIVSYADYYDQKAYYLASVADQLMLNKMGQVDLKGLSAQLFFVKDFLDKIGVEAQVIRHGTYKSAVEPLIQNFASQENLTQTKAYIQSVWNIMLTEISTMRNISVEQLNEYSDSLYAFDAEMAFEKKIVDKLVYEDEVIAFIKEKLKIKDDKKINFAGLNQCKNEVQHKSEGVRDRIAIIYALGEIKTGKGTHDEIGDESLIKEIKKAVDKKNVKAIVLRINSPGGSSLASENIHRELAIARTKKPIIVSMGDLAASGGYYIACAADTIVANSMTLTGSIGVFGVLFNAKQMLGEKLGVVVESVNTNKYSDYGTIARSIKDKERFITQKSVEKVYQTFIERVANGRSISLDDADKIAQGRIWSGEKAKELKLTDINGGLQKAIAIAQEMAGIDKYRLYELPEEKNPIEILIAEFGGNQTESLLKSELGEMYQYYNNIKELATQKGTMTRLPFEINIK